MTHIGSAVCQIESLKNRMIRNELAIHISNETSSDGTSPTIISLILPLIPKGSIIVSNQALKPSYIHASLKFLEKSSSQRRAIQKSVHHLSVSWLVVRLLRNPLDLLPRISKSFTAMNHNIIYDDDAASRVEGKS